MREPVRLNSAALASIDGEVRRPSYDRRTVVPAICHIGVGGFHRGHQAVYLDDLLHHRTEMPWGCCGIGLLQQDTHMRDVLAAQDNLYTVVEQSASTREARIVGSIVDYVFAPQSPSIALDRLSSPACRIVSLTITEGGYYANEVTGEFDARHPEIIADLQKPHEPRCSFGVIVEALDRRRRASIEPFTVLSCDNVRHNGDLARRMLIAFASLRNTELAAWIENNVTFPNSMVDRIVPATTKAHRAALTEQFGIVDAWPVVTEPFRQWVIEDRFPGGRPEWERVGVQMTNDVDPYEKMKMRLLNGSHQALCHIGMLLGYSTVDEAIADPQILALVRRFMDDEVTPLLVVPTGVDLDRYRSSLVERFSNPAIADQLPRIGTDASARIPKFVLPSIIEQLDRGGPVTCLSFTVASWFHFLAEAGDGARPSVIDPHAARLVDAARRGKSDPSPLLAMADLFDARLCGSARFRDVLTTMLINFNDVGPRETLLRALSAA